MHAHAKKVRGAMSMFVVTVPDGVQGGQALQVTTPDGVSMTTVVPDGLKAGDAFQVPMQPVAVATVTAVPAVAAARTMRPDERQELARRHGKLPWKDALEHYKSLPEESKDEALKGCKKVYCGPGCCEGQFAGCTYNTACGKSCFWTPACFLFNPMVYLGPFFCYCKTRDGTGWTDGEKKMRWLTVDEEKGISACYNDPNDTVTPCLYCE